MCCRRSFPHTAEHCTWYCIKTDESQNIKDVFKEAEDRMYRHKLLHGKNAHNTIIASLSKNISNPDGSPGKQIRNITDIAIKLGEAVSLSDRELDELKLVAELHDLGEKSIPQSILQKQGRLTCEEWEIMKMHAEKGSQIAESTKQLSFISDYIRHHHENWDGSGYPDGLSGLQIPKLSRIISIIDAYNGMTRDSTYKQKLSHSEALDEIKRCAGTQFDPELAKVFVGIMK
jgi:HD-GYP domain-containing protein (c-di-GMP phosphodiesterase class II)